MNRLIHGALALLALGIVVGMVIHWSDRRPPPQPSAGRSTPVAPTRSPEATDSPDATPPQPTDPGTTVQPCTHPGPEARLSVLTLNIHGALGHGRLDLGAIADTITASRADVVFLEEVDRYRARTDAVDQTAWLAHRLGMHSAYGANKRRPPARAGLPRGAIGNAILSRFPMHDVSNTHLPNRPGMELRGLLHARLDVRGRSVSVYVTHLQHTSGSMRIEQAHAIRRVIDADPLPKILGGDLNAEPGTRPLRVLQAGGLHDSWAAVGRGEGLTVPAYVPHRRIDFVLHDDLVRPVAASVRRSGLSDHRGVWADLVVPAVAPC